MDDPSGISTIIDNGHEIVQRSGAQAPRFVTSTPYPYLPERDGERISGNQD